MLPCSWNLLQRFCAWLVLGTASLKDGFAVALVLLDDKHGFMAGLSKLQSVYSGCFGHWESCCVFLVLPAVAFIGFCLIFSSVNLFPWHILSLFSVRLRFTEPWVSLLYRSDWARFLAQLFWHWARSLCANFSFPPFPFCVASSSFRVWVHALLLHRSVVLDHFSDYCICHYGSSVSVDRWTCCDVVHFHFPCLWLSSSNLQLARIKLLPPVALFGEQKCLFCH